MTSIEHARNVGAPDPELSTSPIADENDTEGLRENIPGEAVCYFNSNSFPTGTYVKSGTSLLLCDYGIWMVAGAADQDNP